jgi:hypothetical protein
MELGSLTPGIEVERLAPSRWIESALAPDRQTGLSEASYNKPPKPTR